MIADEIISVSFPKERNLLNNIKESFVEQVQRYEEKIKSLKIVIDSIDENLNIIDNTKTPDKLISNAVPIAQAGPPLDVKHVSFLKSETQFICKQTFTDQEVPFEFTIKNADGTINKRYKVDVADVGNSIVSYENFAPFKELRRTALQPEKNKAAAQVKQVIYNARFAKYTVTILRIETKDKLK